MSNNSMLKPHTAFLRQFCWIFALWLLLESSSVAQETPVIDQQDQIPPKVKRFAEWLIRKHDTDHNGIWQEEEWKNISGHPSQYDGNQDRVITTEEIASFAWAFAREHQQKTTPSRPSSEHPSQAPQQNPASPGEQVPRRETRFYVSPGRLPEGLPDWFRDRDLDGDAQLTLAEFAPPDQGGDLNEFRRLDLNSDGILTPSECKPRQTPQGKNKSEKALSPQP